MLQAEHLKVLLTSQGGGRYLPKGEDGATHSTGIKKCRKRGKATSACQAKKKKTDELERAPGHEIF